MIPVSMNGDGPSSKQGARLLQSPSLKIQVLEELGADWLLTPPFSDIRGLTPEAFAIDVLYWGLHAKVVCCGYDYRFGKGACAGADELSALLAPLGVEVRQLGAVLDDGAPISSTRIRASLEAGDAETAARLLGRPYSIDFPVTHGKGLGNRLFGFPTANQVIEPAYLAPRFGVYATRVQIDGVCHSAVTNVGVKPTVGSDCVSAESFIENWSGDLYGRRIETQFLSFLRPEKRFASVELLREAICADAAHAREISARQTEDSAL
ncbi:MAG: riboflavin kinase [Oscillospiraceae bacterium]